MCLAVPGKVVAITKDEIGLSGRVDFGGTFREIRLDFVPETVEGDYVLVHVGFAIGRMNVEEAERTLKLLDELAKQQQREEAGR